MNEEERITIRLVDRGHGRCQITEICGLLPGSSEHALRNLRQRLNCPGTIAADRTTIQLKGDKRDAVAELLLTMDLNRIVIH